MATTVLRLHRGGRFRAWLGARFGGDIILGDRIWRRLLHLFGAAAVVYYLLPATLWGPISTEGVLLAALIAIIAIETLRHVRGVELPTIREFERHRVASFVFYAIALVLAILLFPRPIATVVILGTSLVDPLAGELRMSAGWKRAYPYLPAIVYAVLAVIVLSSLTGWSWERVALFAGVASVAAIAVERPKMSHVDDDLVMTLVPALLLLAMSYAVVRLGPVIP